MKILLENDKFELSIAQLKNHKRLATFV